MNINQHNLHLLETLSPLPMLCLREPIDGRYDPPLFDRGVNEIWKLTVLATDLLPDSSVSTDGAQ